MEALFADGVGRLNEQGIVVTLLVMVICALVWDRSKILKEYRMMTDKLIETIKEYGENNVKVITDNTQAFTQLANAIKERR